MLEKINKVLSGIGFTTAGAVFLILSYILNHTGRELPVDPAWFTVIVCGLPLVYLAVWRLIHNEGISKISSALLIVIAMIAAVLIGDLFAAGEVAFIMAIGAILEDKTTERAQRGLKGLIELAPQKARRVLDGKTEMVDIGEIRTGETIRVLAGERIPADGIILSGETSVDQSVMTGESLPVDKMPGDEVYCGTVSCFGSVDLRVTGTGEDSSLQKLIRLMKEAENHQAPVQRIADRWASILVPVALLIAVATLLFTKDITRAVTVLVVFCPCALVLSTPTAIMAAVGQASKHGVIIKSGESLEKMGKADLIAFDKTGTITTGQLTVTDVWSIRENVPEEEILRLCASAEEKSSHPLGRAVVQYAKEQHTELYSCGEFSMDAGRGITASVNGLDLTCGNEKYLAEKGIGAEELAAVREKTETLRNQGKAIILMSDDRGLLGGLALSDEIRPDAAEAIEKLHKLKVGTVLLTGDHETNASFMASKTGLSEVRAELLPEDKVSYIRRYQQSGHILCMIGDGINDAPAMKTADIGVAMGSMGSDIAVEAADIALMSDDLSNVPYLKWLANACVSTIRICITTSMTINLIAIILSVAGILTPTTGALVHNAGSCFVVLMAALLYDRKPVIE